MRWACLVFSLVCPAVSVAADGADGGAPPTSGDPAIGAIDALWHERGDPAKAEEGIEKAQAALAAKPDDGDRMVKAKPDWVGGNYYAAAGIGIYSQAVGILKALGEGLEAKFNERLDKAIQLDPRFQKEMPLIAKGRYFFELPWPKRNLGKSATWYRKALAVNPNNLRATAWLAETLWRDGDVAGAKAQLAKVAEAHDPDDPAEEDRVKSIAKKIAAQMEKEGAR